MNLEVIDFFPLEYDEKRNFLSGTLRVRLLDIGIDMLGVYAARKKDFWMFSLPNRKGVNHKTGLSVIYPLISFIDKEKQSALIASIRQKGPVFIENRLADTENPIVFPNKIKIEQTQAIPSEVRNNAPLTKETASVLNPESKVSIVSKIKVFVDPPPRKFPAKRAQIRNSYESR
jgi:hypothetical protein